MQRAGICKKCGGNDLEISKGIYTCKDCGYIGSVKEWFQKNLKNLKDW